MYPKGDIIICFVLFCFVTNLYTLLKLCLIYCSILQINPELILRKSISKSNDFENHKSISLRIDQVHYNGWVHIYPYLVSKGWLWWSRPRPRGLPSLKFLVRFLQIQTITWGHS